MSTALGIASVTHVLKDLLNDGLINNNVATAVGTVVGVSSLPPGQVEVSDNSTQLNMFLYRVSSNTGWNNLGYPSRNGRGEIVNNPPLALNLHYLLTAFGEQELHAEILLGYGMQILHENPVLLRSKIRASLNVTVADDLPPILPANLLSLSTSELAEQIEQIKITNENINTEEMSRLWTAFQTKYRPCTAYQATVVLIESNKSTSNPLPVLERKFYTIPFKQPIIEKILSQTVSGAQIRANQRITVEHKIVIQGKQLKKEGLIILINGEEFYQDTDDIISDTQVSIDVPSSLKAGVLGVQIVHPVMMGMPPEPRRGTESNLQAFVLSPLISNPDIFIDTNGDRFLSVDVRPGVQQGQRIILLLNELNPSSGENPKSYSAILPAADLLNAVTPVTNIAFPINGFANGDYLIRIQVDGAESPLFTNTSEEYDDPQINIS